MAKAPAKLVQALQTLGSPRVEAVILAHLLKNESVTTADLLSQTGLRQPEVSIGMKRLKAQDLVNVETIPREGKGRPMNRYTLSQSKAKVSKTLKERSDNQITALKASIDTIKSA